MSEKILYYLGAGASANALPLAKTIYTEKKEVLVNGLPSCLKNTGFTKIIGHTGGRNYDEYLADLIERCSQLGTEAEKFSDVDTYAKYLHLKDSDNLSSLKKTLSEFFVVKQILMNAYDKRYVSWIVSIANKPQFPKNIKILSWNYDFQVQLAANYLGDSEDINYSGGSWTYSPPYISHLPTLDPYPNENDEFTLIHLNGIAGYSMPEGIKRSSVFQPKNRALNTGILDYLISVNRPSQIHFAWENSIYHSNLLKQVDKILEDITIVVVVGYSFPFFNREVDKRVFSTLNKVGKVRKIYYQDPVLDGHHLLSKFALPKDLEIINITSSENFHIPFEY